MTRSKLARWIALCGGAGLLKPGPGTWGSLAGLAIGVAVHVLGGAQLTFLVALLAFAAGYLAAQIYADETQIADPSEVVIDEAAAMLLVVAFSPFSLTALMVGFVLFRIFDIAKPWPVSWADRSLPGALGIMADDFIAALMALAGVWLAQRFLIA